jgi:hypothetical protein
MTPDPPEDTAEDADVLAAIDRLIEQGTDADDILRTVVAELVAKDVCTFAGILFFDDGELVLGPEAGTPDADHRTQLPVTYKGDPVAELVSDGAGDRALLERVAERVSAHCLVGWDTGGAPWDPAA